MTPFLVDPAWYEQYWLHERPAPQRRTLLRGLIRAAAEIVRPPRTAVAACYGSVASAR
jgi:hypothetical protein